MAEETIYLTQPRQGTHHDKSWKQKLERNQYKDDLK